VKAAQHSGYGIDMMTALNYTSMTGNKNQGKSFENLPFVHERSMCKVAVKEYLLQKLVFLRVSEFLCSRTLEMCLEDITRISTTPHSTA
jgi:hypothetical protein